MRFFEVSNRVPWLLALAAVAALLGVGLFASLRRRAPAPEPEMHAPETVAAEKVDPWKEAALKVEEDRGEETGRKAEIEIPDQLKHYEDRRRFLASQVAAWREYGYDTPHDYADLAAMIRRGELVEAPALGESHLLYGVGLSASDEPFTHYDRESGESVTLYGSDEELSQEYALIDDSLKQSEETVKELQAQLKDAPAKDRALRRKINDEIKERREEADALKERRKLLDGFYKNEKRRAVLAAEYAEIAALARDFGGKSYDLSDPASRKELKVRLLSHVRPAALKVIEEVAASYREKFGRHLPVTSLVRTDEYQRRLSKTNPNATLIEVAPHTVGLAFDVFYRFLTAEEQQHVMTDLARLRDEGRVEALYERRDHYHVFAYAEGRPPDESLIREQLGLRAAPEKKKEEKREEKKKETAAAKRAGKKETRAAAAAKSKARGREAASKSNGKSAPQRSAARRDASPRRRAARGGV